MLSERITGLVLLLFSSAYLVATLTMEEPSGLRAAIGPKAFPVLLAVSMAILSIMLIAGASKKDDEKKWSRKEIIDTAVVVGLMLIYGLTYEVVGFLVGTTVFLVVSMAVMGRGGKKYLPMNVLISLVFTAVMYLSFTKILDVPLPKGILPL